MMKLLHIPEQIIKSIESGGGLQRTEETNTFIISNPHETACKINFHPDEDVLMAKPVIKMPKFSDRPSPSYSFPPGSSRLHSATSSRYSETTNKASALYGTRKNLLLSERENFLTQTDEAIFKKFISAESD